MPQINDFVFFSYSHSPFHPILSIGWLGEEEEFNQGLVPIDFLKKLMEIVKDPSSNFVSFTRGFHDNILPKEPDNKAYYQENIPDLLTQYPIGNGEMHFRLGELTYAAPAMIYEYIVENGYLPPKEFIEAVLKGRLLTKADWKVFEENREKVESLGPNMNRDEIRPFYQKARELQGDYEKLEKLVQQYRANYPRDPQVLFVGANHYMAAGKHGEALRYAKLLLEVSPHWAQAYGTKGMADYHLKNYEEAEKNLRLILPTFRADKTKTSVHVLFALGDISEQKNNREQALIYYREALVYDPEDQGVKNAIARLERNQSGLLQKIMAWFN
ncbi:MAG: tetratricopeptide repeat protein [Bacteroidota bacterium]